MKAARKWAATKRPGFSLFAFNLTVATKCNYWIKLSWGPENIILPKN
jgi:hypothetical protein